jgi:uncharacterized protein (DUF2384 family)
MKAKPKSKLVRSDLPLNDQQPYREWTVAMKRGVQMIASRSSRISWYRTVMLDAAEDCLGASAEAALVWAKSPAFGLGGRVPWRVCMSRKGCEECVLLLRRIDRNISC